MKLLVVVMFAIIAVGCSDSEPKKSKPKVAPTFFSAATKEELDSCNAMADEQTVYGKWVHELKQAGAQKLVVYEIFPTFFSQTIACKYENSPEFYATSGSAATVTNKQISVFHPNGDVQIYSQGNTDYQCSSTLTAFTVDYWFEGGCLAMGNSNQFMLFHR